ncbi:hypothetical protein RHMOL_Rhmol07G0293700 [Rhododendron molle]|uniref:Uncharacterized protein n=1 Tax=Rhododendron molle TaxID=49168 RepID=A0ACC0N748_RHOML|nr:hypothetical protein RHMOL_Rhmol07G0293700 [Rhododendron molle]
MGSSFRPDPGMLSLENGWSSLSTAIHSALDGIVFNRPVMLRNVRNEPVTVDSILSPAILGLALQVYKCRAGPQSDDAILGDDDEYTGVLNNTRRISGRDGLCVDVNPTMAVWWTAAGQAAVDFPNG